MNLQLRFAEEKDYGRIITMVTKHVLASPYRDITPSESRIRSVVDLLVNGNRTETILLVGTDGDEAVAVLGATLQELPFSDARVAVEVVWWVNEEYRGTSLGRELVEAYEYWGKNVSDVQYVALASFHTDHLPALKRLYRMWKYEPFEHMFLKRL